MILYLVRHGETDYNVKHIIQGIVNTNLNKTGINQAQNLKKEIDKLDIDLVIVSPLKRAYETASIITKNRNIDFIYDKRIIERNAGDLEEKADIYYDHEKAWNYQLNTDLGYNIETIRELLNRTKNFLNDLKSKYLDKNILVVSHEATIRALHYNIIGYNENTNFKNLKVDNCCLLKYNIES